METFRQQKFLDLRYSFSIYLFSMRSAGWIMGERVTVKPADGPFSPPSLLYRVCACGVDMLAVCV